MVLRDSSLKGKEQGSISALGVFRSEFPSLEAFLVFLYRSFPITLLGFLRVEDKGLRGKNNHLSKTTV